MSGDPFDKIQGAMDIAKAIYKSEVKSEKEPPVYDFPSRFTSVWVGQNNSVSDIIENMEVQLTSPTGSGKTLVFLVAAHELGLPTIIIEPRKFLQKQVMEDYPEIESFAIYGKSEYPCDFSDTAESAPCVSRYKRGENKFFTVPDEKGDSKEVSFPCEGCGYYGARNQADKLLKSESIVITNFGNFWRFREKANFVIIDEANEFFRAITEGTQMKYVSSSKFEYKTPEEILMEESKMTQIELSNLRMYLLELKKDIKLQGVTKEIREEIREELREVAKKINRLESRLTKLDFFISTSDICFHYLKKSGHIYVEILPNHVEVVCKRVFPNHKLCKVTATPTSNDSISYYRIPSRAGIIYFPVAKMTSDYLYTKGHEVEAFDRVSNIIKTIYATFCDEFGTKKTVVHCGNLVRHAPNLKRRLEDEYVIDMHERGNLKGTLDKFVSDNAQFLLVAAAEYGIDFPHEINLQFILKVPYAARDERMDALKKKMGGSNFEIWYEQDAILRLVQACGRVGRGTYFGISFILDAKFGELFQKHRSLIPEWFCERLVES